MKNLNCHGRRKEVAQEPQVVRHRHGPDLRQRCARRSPQHFEPVSQRLNATTGVSNEGESMAAPVLFSHEGGHHLFTEPPDPTSRRSFANTPGRQPSLGNRC